MSSQQIMPQSSSNTGRGRGRHGGHCSGHQPSDSSLSTFISVPFTPPLNTPGLADSRPGLFLPATPQPQQLPRLPDPQDNNTLALVDERLRAAASMIEVSPHISTCTSPHTPQTTGRDTDVLDRHQQHWRSNIPSQASLQHFATPTRFEDVEISSFRLSQPTTATASRTSYFNPISSIGRQALKLQNYSHEIKQAVRLAHIFTLHDMIKEYEWLFNNQKKSPQLNYDGAENEDEDEDEDSPKKTLKENLKENFMAACSKLSMFFHSHCVIHY